MNLQRFALLVTVANCVLLLFVLTQSAPTQAQNTAQTLRGKALEIVDDRGVVRARINIEPATKMPDGTVYPEGVVLRMADPEGRIRVKMGADSEGSGLVLANDTQQPGVQILAKGAGTSLKLTNKNGREQTLKPE
jgi:hypothetical protein